MLAELVCSLPLSCFIPQKHKAYAPYKQGCMSMRFFSGSKYASIFDFGFSWVVSTMYITYTQTTVSLVSKYGHIDQFRGLTS